MSIDELINYAESQTMDEKSIIQYTELERSRNYQNFLNKQYGPTS